MSELKSAMGAFELTDNRGEARFSLTRPFDGETVTVRVDCGHLTELDGEDEASEGEEHGDTDGEGGEEEFPTGYEAVVTVTKPSGAALRFLCVVGDDLIIDSVQRLAPGEDSLAGGTENDEAYKGPTFEDLDVAMQQGFYDYLSERGVDDDLADTVNAYAAAKEQKEYVHWLKDVGEFVGGAPALEA